MTLATGAPPMRLTEPRNEPERLSRDMLQALSDAEETLYVLRCRGVVSHERAVKAHDVVMDVCKRLGIR